MMQHDVEQRVAHIFRRYLSLGNKIPDASLMGLSFESLNMDSLDSMDIVFRLNDAFCINIDQPTEDAMWNDNKGTVGDAVAVVKKLMPPPVVGPAPVSAFFAGMGVSRKYTFG